MAKKDSKKNEGRERTRRTPIQQSRRSRRRRVRRVILTCVILLVLAAVGSFTYLFLTQNNEISLTRLYSKEDPTFGIEKIQLSNGRASSFAEDLCVITGEEESVPVLTSQAALSFNENERETQYAKNPYERLYPASITKVMTALITLENCDLNEKVVIGEECQDIEIGSSVCMIEPGDILTVEQLLYGLLLNSGNDAAMSLAVYVGGTVEHFVEMMNEEAAALGATGTHFTNPHGLQDEDHYTTAYDIYLFFREALTYDAFVEMIEAPEYYCVFTRDGEDYGILWSSTNEYHTGEASLPSDVIMVGGKTGTTEAAGSCLCLLAKDKWGEPHILILLHADTKEILYEEMNQLLSKINN